MGRAYQSIVIDATVDRVWNAVRDFDDLSWAPDVVESVEKGIDDGPSPVSAEDVLDYVGRVSVRPITEGGGTSSTPSTAPS